LGDTIFGSKLYIGYADTAVYEYFTYMPNGCIRSMIDTFYTAQLPNIQIITDYADKSDTVLICLQTIESGQLTLYAEGGMYYQWFAPPEFNDDYLTDHITITTIVDNVWLIGTDSNTCSNIAMLHIMTAKDYGTPDWGDSITCKYYPVSFTADTSLWYNTYTWISPSGQIYNNPQVDIERFEIADSGVWTLLTAHAECVDTSYFRLGMKFFENPVILGIEDFYCEHDTIILETENNDGYSFYWRKLGLPAYSGMRDSIISTDSIVVVYDINDNTSGIYNLQVETRGCYFTTLDFEIDVHKIRLNLPDSTFICIGDIIKIGVNNPNFQHYFWNTGDSTAIINIIKGGIYTVKFADQECENSDSIFVNERLKPYFWLGNDTIICEEDEIELYVDMPDADNIVWQDNSHDNPYLVTSRNIYIATVEKNECFASDTIIVQEKFCRPLYFPTAFAPNSAIVENRIFKTIGTISTDLIEYQMVIYDKSGQLVFQTDDPNVGWDGKMNGRDAPASAYVYQVRLLSITDLTERLYTGTIVLIR
jgi:gliding motility-associated-like protein